METLKWPIIDFFQALSAGLLVGGTYGLMCVGLGIIFGVMRVVNFAQGDFMMLGMYVAYYLVTGFGILAFLGPYAGPVVGRRAGRPDRVRPRLAAASLPDLARHRRPRRLGGGGRPLHADHHDARRGAGALERRSDPVRLGSRCRCSTPLSRESWEIGPIFLNQARSVAFVLAAAYRRARALSVPALAPTSARRCARPPTIRSPRPIWASTSIGCHRFAFGLGVGITAIAGGLIASSQSFQPYIGFDFVIVMYAGVVLGGMGSILGAFWGGLTIGLVQQMSTLVLPYQLQNTAIFVVFLLIMFFRPQGMFGRVSERT